MVVNRRKKMDRQRGNTSHGWGAKKKHRGAGNRGGRGMAGTGKRADQKKESILKEYGNEYFGKRGFVRPGSPSKKAKVINFEQLNKLIEKGEIKKEKEFYIINLDELGYAKLLSKGELRYKIKIKAKAFSKNAIEKIQEQGGEIVSDKHTPVSSGS